MTKLTKILQEWLPEDIHSMKWFKQHGISQQLVHKYYTAGYFDKIGPGVYKRPNDNLNWEAGIRLLQHELNKKIHVASKSALELNSVIHYGVLGKKPSVFVWTYSKETIPTWFKKLDFNCNFSWTQSTLLKSQKLELKKQNSGFDLIISSREQAILEYIYASDLRYSFEDVTHYLEMLHSLRPDVLQKLLENCSSIKVKRTFLYLSEQLNHPYYKKLNFKKIHLGNSRYVIVKNGMLDKKYNITVPKQYPENPF